MINYIYYYKHDSLLSLLWNNQSDVKPNLTNQ